MGPAKARKVLAALLRIGWTIKRQSRGSHRILSRPGLPDVIFAFHDREEIGPKMLARIAKRTGLTPDDLYESSGEPFGVRHLGASDTNRTVLPVADWRFTRIPQAWQRPRRACWFAKPGDRLATVAAATSP
jgi:predicted RNA binding protein YcfA (HicA-like mRNA interferase family)